MSLVYSIVELPFSSPFFPPSSTQFEPFFFKKDIFARKRVFICLLCVVDIQKMANIIHNCKKEKDKINLYIKSVNGKSYSSFIIVNLVYLIFIISLAAFFFFFLFSVNV